MKQSVDMKQSVKMVQLQTQLEAVEKFERLFNSENITSFESTYGGRDLVGTVFHDMTHNHLEQTAFRTNVEMKEHIDTARDYFKSMKAGNESLFSAVSNAFDSRLETQKKQLDAMRKLIAAQKDAVTSAIEIKKLNSVQEIQLAFRKKLAVKKLNALKAEKTTASRYKVLRSVGIGAMLATGAGLTTASALMQFNPQFVMLVGMHLPIAALAAVAVTGVAMAAYAAFSTYRSFYPAQVAPEVTVEEVKAVESTTDATPVVPNPMHAKLLTAGLATVGLSMAGFSAMMQFGPKFALLAGVNLNPAALIAIAAVGALLLSISLYREVSAYIKARAEAPAADVVENIDTNTRSEVEPQPTYVQRVSNFFSAFMFAGKPVVEQTVEQTETVTNNL